MQDLVEFVVFWLAVVFLPAGLAFARPRRVWWVVALGGVLALVWWGSSWFGSTEGADGTYSRSQVVAFGALVVGATLCIWTGAAWAGRLARYFLSRRSRPVAPS